ncbi:GNAT family N-acetyltransferase [Kitasatospora cheerisanensis]|uniref:GNAT family N-acetyltransferase n=1 Tax=Kitasatospora cheerisanensis TaxID=81942 RepID=UPI00055AC8C8|nr:GNAT family N-acetyltransferase [Kitasatospora cheerisanensis]
MALPEGMTVRPAVLGDAEAVCALLNQVDEIEVGRAFTELHEVEEDLGHPSVDLERDSWLLYDAAGQLVGYGIVRDRSAGERINLDQYLLPGHTASGLHLFGLMEARGAELARGNGADRAVLHLMLTTEPTIDTGALAGRGWRLERRHHVLTRAVDPKTDPFPEAPAGLRLRSCATEEDRRTVHRLLHETFAEHYDFQPRSYEKWCEDTGADSADWSLVWIAGLDGHGDVAVLRTRADRADQAWASHIGVLAEHRGRGIGGYLLRYFFAVYAERGHTRVGLGVDTENATGAPALYRDNGMELDFAVDTWELVVPAR